MRLKKLLSFKTQLQFGAYFLATYITLFVVLTGIIKVYEFISNPVNQETMASVLVPRASAEKRYEYNDLVPKEVQLREIDSLSKRFNFSETTKKKWKDTIQCESNFNNLAQNNTSTALGSCQYLIRTWMETESFKQLRKTRTDPFACLWEMALDIQADETWRWECWR